MLKFLYFMAKQ